MCWVREVTISDIETHVDAMGCCVEKRCEASCSDSSALLNTCDRSLIQQRQKQKGHFADAEDARTENDRVLRLPIGRMREDTHAVEHDADRERVVRGAGAGEGAVEVGVDEDGVCFALGGAVRDAHDDVGEVDVGLVEALAHHVEAGGGA